MSKRTFIRVVAFFVTALAIMFGTYLKEHQRSRRYKTILQNGYTHAMYNLSESVNNISTDLKKATYVTTPKAFSSYAAKIYCESELAKEALGKLPGNTEKLDTINLFLSQVGNFALSVSKDMIAGKEITQTQKDNLDLLAKTAETVSKTVENTEININNADYWSTEINNKISGKIDKSALASALTELEEKLTDYPTLIYDGPYSDHILSKKPTVIANKPEVGKNQAQNLARRISGTTENLQYTDTVQGKIECYLFRNNSLSISISKLGGYPVYMLKNRDIGTKNLTNEELCARAERFLTDNGFNNMIITYFESKDGILTANFAYLDGQTVCYTDLIKVGVAEDNGEIYSFESVGYLTNHTSRVFEAPKYTEEEALASISSGLATEGAKITLIPTSGGGEVRCYEFKCTSDDNDILVYVNTATLECENIYILLIGENGTLVK